MHLSSKVMQALAWKREESGRTSTWKSVHVYLVSSWLYRVHGQILLWLSPAGQRVASVLVGITVFKKGWVPLKRFLKGFPHLCSSLCAEPQSGQPFVDS